MFRENCSIIFLSQDSSVGVATDYRLDGWGRDKRLYSTVLRPALVSTQPPIQWFLGVLTPGVKLTTHLHAVPR
jgi:hypothetical protein